MSNDHDPLRRTVIVALASAPLLALTGTENNGEAPRSGSRILVAYFSRSGNTRVVAEQVRKERDGGFEPTLESKVREMADYDILFLGFPIWGETAPPVVRLFLSAHDLTGKTIIPFNTHGGYGLGNSRTVLENHAPKAKVMEGFVMEGEQERKTMERVNEWLSDSHLIS